MKRWLWKVFAPKGVGFDGLKTIIGAALIVLAGQIDVLNDLIPLFPHTPWLSTVIVILKKILVVLEWIAKILGNGFLTVGALHKVKKAIT